MPPLIRDVDLPLDDFALRVRTIASDDAAAEGRPTLVFLHDSLGCITVWRDFPARMTAATGCDALIYDRRGYGASSPFGTAPRTTRYLDDEADVLWRVLDAVGVRETILFGHSDGGTVALLSAAQRPDRVRAVVTEGAHVFVEEVSLAGIRVAQEALRTTDLRERLWRHHGELTDAVTAAWIDVWLSPEFRDWNIEHRLPAITSAVLVLQGAEDEFGTAAQVHAIVDGVRGMAQAHLFPHVGHTPHRDVPDDVITRTLDFLREVVPESL